MNRITILLIALVWLVSCAKVPEPSGFSPTSPKIPDAILPTLPPPVQPSSTTSQSVPGESASPDTPDDPITAAYKHGELVINADGWACNYQPWLEFTLALDAGYEAELTVLKLNEGGGEYGQRFHAEKNGSAVWRRLFEEDAADALEGSTFTFSYDPYSGVHTLCLDEYEVLVFTYYPPSPSAIAEFWGHAPLEEVAPFYTWHEALADGCLVITDKVENIGMMTAFAETFGFDDGSYLRVFEVSSQGVMLTDISYNGERACVTQDATRAGGEISTRVFNDCVLTLIDTKESMELKLLDRQTGLEQGILTVKK